MGFFDIFKKKKKMSDGLEKTRTDFFQNIVNTLTSSVIDDDLYNDLEEQLILADVGPSCAVRLVDELRDEVEINGLHTGQEALDALRDIIRREVSPKTDLDLSGKPAVILVVGVNGVGKTTTIAKLAYLYKDLGKRVMLAAGDTFRAAASEQLETWADRAGVPLVKAGEGADPAAVIFDAVKSATARGYDMVIADTAGRLQIDEVLMQELVQIKEAVPVDETLLVVDAMAGQDAVNVAKTFNETVGIDGIILTKTDGDTRGGAALSVLSVTGKPIKFQGTGEKLDDLEVFHPSRMASRILGMGDVLSLIERAQDAADEKLAEETAKRMMENKFDMNDMLAQFAQIRKMGGAGAMLSMMPGMSGIDASQIDEKAFDRIEAMIYSMTKAEREDPSIINPKRKRRIAAGSGTQVSDVNKLLKQFEMMQKMMKQFKKSPKGFARKLGGLMGNPGAFRGMK